MLLVANRRACWIGSENWVDLLHELVPELEDNLSQSFESPMSGKFEVKLTICS